MITKHNTCLFSMLVIAGLLSSCSGSQPKEDTETEKPKKEELSLSPEQMRTVGISLGKIEQRNLNDVVKASGQLAVPPQNKADVSVLNGGIIHTISVLEGQHVNKGQLLVTIENQELIRIQQDYLGARNNFSYIQAEYNRQQQLKAAGAGTGKSYQAAAAAYDTERSKIKAYESQLKQLGVNPAQLSAGHIVSHFPLVSPISGTIGQITANTGAYVQPGTAIMEVVDNSKIHCDLIVFEKDLMKVNVGQKVDFQLTNQQNLQIKGIINGVNKSFENESKGVIVHAVIENTAKQNLIPGMYVTALINVGTRLCAAVPVDAVVRAEGREYIFVVKTGTPGDQVYFNLCEVKTGVSEAGYVQITPLSPLAENTSIVVSGAFYLQSKSSGGAEE